MNKNLIIGIVLGFLIGGAATYMWCPRVPGSQSEAIDIVSLYDNQKITDTEIIKLINHIRLQNLAGDANKHILNSTSWNLAKSMVEKYQKNDPIHLFNLLQGEPKQEPNGQWISKRVTSWVITKEDIDEMLKTSDDSSSALTMNGIRVFMALNYHKPADTWYNTLAMVPVWREIQNGIGAVADTVYNNILDSHTNSSQPNGVAYEYVRPCPKYCNEKTTRQIGKND